jgi:hypothetical protein
MGSRTVAYCALGSDVFRWVEVPRRWSQHSPRQSSRSPSRCLEPKAPGADAAPERPRRQPNRKLPKVSPPALTTALAEQPTDAELFRVRAFSEPFVPVGRATTPVENRAFARALRTYLRDKNPEHVALLLEFLLAHPDTPCRASLLANLGTVYSQTGYFSRALQSWTDAWNLARGATDPRQLAVANTQSASGWG